MTDLASAIPVVLVIVSLTVLAVAAWRRDRLPL
jgi:hypothetical protein